MSTNDKSINSIRLKLPFHSKFGSDFLILRKTVLIEMVRVKKRRVGAVPLWPMSSHKPHPSLVSFPVFFLEWKGVNGFSIYMLTICAAYSVRETSQTVLSSTTFAGLAIGIHANKRSKLFCLLVMTSCVVARIRTGNTKIAMFDGS